MIGATLISAGLLAAPVAGAADDTDHPSQARDAAAKQCAAEKKADRVAFKATYGKHAMRNCIKGETDDQREERTNAARECRAEQAADPAAFEASYGTYNGSNAFGKCVSSKSKAEDEEDVAEFKNAAKECKAERSADADAFRETYGTNRNGRNALGKCVSQKVKAADDDDEDDTDDDSGDDTEGAPTG